MSKFIESVVEEAALEWLHDLGYTILHGPAIAYGEPDAERTDPSYRDVVLAGRLRHALSRLNPGCPDAALDEAFRKLTVIDGPSLVERNRTAWRLLVEGVSVEFQREDGSIGGWPVRVVDFDNPDNNDWVAVNQFTVYEGIQERRPDIVVFLNGLPIAGIELKNAADEHATIWTAYDQSQTYKHQIPSLYVHNAILCISDGMAAKVGSLTAEPERFQAWRTIEGEELAPKTMPQLQVAIQGIFEKERLLDFLKYFIVFEMEDEKLAKKIAAYHQFHAVRRAVEATEKAAKIEGDGRAGVVWHTQGSGKSLTMVFYASMLAQDLALANPTIVVLTDRNDLDGQLFATFSRCNETLRQMPQQAESREHLKELLQVSSGGIVFTTIQKFFAGPHERFPKLSERHNIVVIADEAHRSQYDLVDGFARHMRDALPNASYIGFTGTPIDSTDINTRAIFGDYISVYDIQRAVEDKATVPIFYENRLAKLALRPEETPNIDPSFEEATESEELERKEKLKTKWAAVEALVGTEKRLKVVAEDLVRHFEERTGQDGKGGLEGKGMIVCMSRRICVELYKQIVAIRPEWHSDDVNKGAIKVVMTGSATDPLDFHPHTAGNKERREKLARRFKDPSDSMRLAIVRDMWLTGFDVPCLHTMYVDKYMQAHGLMQAIARVNRVFRDKQGGLIVDYLGIAPELERALRTYIESGGKGQKEVARPVYEAVEMMLKFHADCCALFNGFDWSIWSIGVAVQRLGLLSGAQEHILTIENGKERLATAVRGLTRAYTLANPHEDARRILDDIGFFQAVKSALAKSITQEHAPRVDVEHAIRQIVSNAVASTEVVDIFAAAGLKKPEISILSDAFLGEIKRMPQKHLALELLRKMLNEEIKTSSRKNVVQSRRFSELLQEALRKYQNRALEAAQVIEELIAVAKEIREAAGRGDKLGLSEDEVAFYDALEVNDSAVKVLGDETLKMIAKELVEKVRSNVTIDWTSRESVRANLRVIVRRILRKYGYPPDKQEAATRTVLEQAEVLSVHWSRTA